MVNRHLLYSIGATIISVMVALSIGALLILGLGGNPIQAIYALFAGALGNNFGLGSTINLTTILLFTGLASLLAFSAGVWNFGMEGQLYIGSLAAVGVVFGAQSLGLLVVPIALLTASVAGGLYASIAGVLKVKLNVFEAVSTILLNYIA